MHGEEATLLADEHKPCLKQKERSSSEKVVLNPGFLSQSLGCVQLFFDPRDSACQAPLSMGFPSQEYWSGLLLPSPGDFPDLGIEPMSPAAPALQADSLPLSYQGSPMSSIVRF